MKQGDNTTRIPDGELPVSARIRSRLQQEGRRFFANDHIADVLRDGELDALIDEVAVRMQGVLESLVIDTESDHNTQDTARREGAMGWVRNLPDGRVEAVVEGESEIVTKVEQAIRSGPRGARVEKIDVDDEEVGGYRNFTIER